MCSHIDPLFQTACHWMTPFLFFTFCSHLMTPIFKMLSHLMTPFFRNIYRWKLAWPHIRCGPTFCFAVHVHHKIFICLHPCFLTCILPCSCIFHQRNYFSFILVIILVVLWPQSGQILTPFCTYHRIGDRGYVSCQYHPSWPVATVFTCLLWYQLCMSVPETTVGELCNRVFGIWEGDWWTIMYVFFSHHQSQVQGNKFARNKKKKKKKGRRNPYFSSPSCGRLVVETPFSL